MAPLAKNKMAIKELVTNDNEDILKYEVWVLINTKELFDINYNANIDFIKKYIPEKYIIVLEYFDTKTVLINHPDINFTITIMYKEGTKKEPFIEDFIFQKK